MARANAAYYATHDPFADFTTAPEISQVFGEILGLWAAVMWDHIGRPNPVLLVEAGPGRGTLMADALRAIKEVAPAFGSALRLHLIETSPRLRALQAARLPAAVWHDALDTLPNAPLLLLANEFLDALPVRQFVRRGDVWLERFVEDGRFVEVAAEIPPWSDRDLHPPASSFLPSWPCPPSRSDLHPPLWPFPPSWSGVSRPPTTFRGLQAKSWVVGIRPTMTTDAGPTPNTTPTSTTTDTPTTTPAPNPHTILELGEPAHAFLRTLATRVTNHPGAALFLDYGPEHSAPGDSLQALRNGQPADPLADPGTADLTAHVDFAALAATARTAGTATHGPLPQGLFLTRLGLFQRTDRLARTQPPPQALALIEAARRLAEPDRMGRLFKALAVCHPGCPTPPGFEADSQ